MAVVISEMPLLYLDNNGSVQDEFKLGICALLHFIKALAFE